MANTYRVTARLAAAFAALMLTTMIRTSTSAKCTQAEVQADRTIGPMIGFLAAPPPSDADRAIAKSRLREIRAMVAPYRHGVDAPRDAARYTAAGMLIPVQSPPALAERGPRHLLYRQSAGGLRLEAAEFAFPHDTAVRELNAILPLSIARWHQTTYRCTAPPAFIWIATVFPYAHGDGAIWRTLEVPRYVEIAPHPSTPERSVPRAFR